MNHSDSSGPVLLKEYWQEYLAVTGAGLAVLLLITLFVVCLKNHVFGGSRSRKDTHATSENVTRGGNPAANTNVRATNENASSGPYENVKLPSPEERRAAIAEQTTQTAVGSQQQRPGNLNIESEYCQPIDSLSRTSSQPSRIFTEPRSGQANAVPATVNLDDQKYAEVTKPIIKGASTGRQGSDKSSLGPVLEEDSGVARLPPNASLLQNVDQNNERFFQEVEQRDDGGQEARGIEMDVLLGKEGLEEGGMEEGVFLEGGQPPQDANMRSHDTTQGAGETVAEPVDGKPEHKHKYSKVNKSKKTQQDEEFPFDQDQVLDDLPKEGCGTVENGTVRGDEISDRRGRYVQVELSSPVNEGLRNPAPQKTTYSNVIISTPSEGGPSDFHVSASPTNTQSSLQDAKLKHQYVNTDLVHPSSDDSAFQDLKDIMADFPVIQDYPNDLGLPELTEPSQTASGENTMYVNF